MNGNYITYEKKVLEGFQFWVENVLVCNFTKRQMKILGLIYLLSCRNKKLECYIPTLSSFEAIGISRHKIKNELEKLIEMKVVIWEKESMIFTINPNGNEWEVKYSQDHNSKRMAKLLDLNNEIF